MTSLARFAHFLCTALVLVGSAFFSSSAAAQGAGVHVTPSGYRVPVLGMSLVRHADGHTEHSCGLLTGAQVTALRWSRDISRSMSARSPRATVQSTHGTAFEIIYTDPAGEGFADPQVGELRRQAMEATMRAWSAVLQISVPIIVTASMKAPEDPNSSLLASAGPVDMATIDGRLVPIALASQLTGSRTSAEAADIVVTINPGVDWDYSLNGAAADGKSSFVYTMIHEVGHGLGFLSTFDPETGAMHNPLPTPFDVFVNRGMSERNPLTARSTGQVQEDLTSGDLFFSGPRATEASARSIRPMPMVKLFAPNPYEPGSSTSHVDQETYADFKVGLMAPKDFGSGTDKIDILTLGIMADIGYKLVPDAVTARVPRQ